MTMPAGDPNWIMPDFENSGEGGTIGLPGGGGPGTYRDRWGNPNDVMRWDEGNQQWQNRTPSGDGLWNIIGPIAMGLMTSGIGAAGTAGGVEAGAGATAESTVGGAFSTAAQKGAKNSAGSGNPQSSGYNSLSGSTGDTMSDENYGDNPEFGGSTDGNFDVNQFLTDYGSGSTTTGSSTGTGLVDDGSTWDGFLKRILGGGGTNKNGSTGDRTVDLLSILQNLYTQNKNENRTAAAQNTALSRGDPFGTQRPYYQKMYKDMNSGNYDWSNDPFLANALRASDARMSAAGYNRSGNQQHELLNSAGSTMLGRIGEVGKAAGVGIAPPGNLFPGMQGFSDSQNQNNLAQSQLIGFGAQTLRDMLKNMNTDNPTGGGTPPYQNDQNTNNGTYNLSL